MEIQLAKKTKLRILCFIEPPQFKPISTNCSFKDTKASGQLINPCWFMVIFKGSPDPSHFIFGIIVGKSRIRHRTTLKLNFYIDSKSTEDQVN